MPTTDSLPTTTSVSHKIIALDTTQLMHECDAPWSAREQASTYSGKIPYTRGLTPENRPELPGYNSGIMALLIGIFLLITLNFRHYTTFIKTFTQNLFSVRKRANVFDDHSTTNEARILISLIILLCVCEGILIFSATARSGAIIDNFAAVGLFTGLAATFFALQLTTYRILGYIFTTRNRAIMWVKGFNASQSLLGITLVIPSLILLFNPDALIWLSIAAALYIIARIIFIIKGFRIFYHNSFGLIYFILYLCTLEIIPLFLIYKASNYCTSILCH